MLQIKKKKKKICKEIMLGSNRTKEARTLFKLNVPQYKYHGLVLISKNALYN